MPHFTIAEPHPTVGQNAYMHSGRGGAGNYFRAPATTTSTTTTTTKPKSATPPPPRSASNFYSGRGGAGNAHVSATRPVMSFDEELARRESRRPEQKHVGYVGRGGAGNVFDTTPSPVRKDCADDDGASGSSSRSSSSLRDRVSAVFGSRR